MDNEEFDYIDELSDVIETLKKIAYIFEGIVFLTLMITGIVLAVEGALAYGLVLFLVGLIGGSFVLYLTYCCFLIMSALVKMMYDVKYIRMGERIR